MDLTYTAYINASILVSDLYWVVYNLGVCMHQNYVLSMQPNPYYTFHTINENSVRVIIRIQSLLNRWIKVPRASAKSRISTCAAPHTG